MRRRKAHFGPSYLELVSTGAFARLISRLGVGNQRRLLRAGSADEQGVDQGTLGMDASLRLGDVWHWDYIGDLPELIC